MKISVFFFFFFFKAEDGIRYYKVTGLQTCALPIWLHPARGLRPPRRPGPARADVARTPTSHRHKPQASVSAAAACRTGCNFVLAPGQIPAAAPITARPAHAATVPAMISHATGLPKLGVQPTPKRAPTTMAGSSRLT